MQGLKLKKRGFPLESSYQMLLFIEAAMLPVAARTTSVCSHQLRPLTLPYSRCSFPEAPGPSPGCSRSCGGRWWGCRLAWPCWRCSAGPTSGHSGPLRASRHRVRQDFLWSGRLAGETVRWGRRDCSRDPPLKSGRWAKELPRQMTASKPSPGFWTSSANVSQLASSMTERRTETREWRSAPDRRGGWQVGETKELTPPVESRLLSPLPPRLQCIFKHFVTGVHAHHVKALFHQHNGVNPGK